MAGYSLLGAVLKELFALNAADQTRTPRDLYVSAVLGHLHDHNMSDFLDLLTEATAYLAVIKNIANALNAIGTDELRVKPGYDGADYFPLLIDAQRHLQADILASALPTGAATDAHQVTQTAALDLIKKLEHALETIHTDRLLVRGMDQLFSYNDSVRSSRVATISGASGYIDSHEVPAGYIWRITRLLAQDNTSPTTAHWIHLERAAAVIEWGLETAAIPAGIRTYHDTHFYLDPGDTVRAYFTGGLAGDQCAVILHGFQMTLET